MLLLFLGMVGVRENHEHGFVSVGIMDPQIVYVCDNTCELQCSNIFNVVVHKMSILKKPEVICISIGFEPFPNERVGFM